MSEPVANPGPAWWPNPDAVTDQDERPFQTLPCGCHIRRPDFEAVLCDAHLAEMNEPLTPAEPVEATPEHGYGTDSDCLCGRNFDKVRGLREHLTKARRSATTTGESDA